VSKAKERIKHNKTSNKTYAQNKSRRTRDSFSNPMARLGNNTSNLIEGTTYTSTRITNNPQLLTTLYREHWLPKKIINSIPEDMLKNWYTIKSKLAPNDLLKFEKLERTTKLKSKLLEGLQWGRLYGGAVGIILIDGHEDMLNEPLDLDMVMPDSFKGLIILDRHIGVEPLTELVMDIGDPDFGLPKYYALSIDTLEKGLTIHHSRVIRFIGRKLPYIDKIAEQYWGASELEHIFDEIKKRDNTSWNMAMLVFLANIKVMKVDGMEEMATMDSQALEELYSTYAMSNQFLSSQGMLVMGKEDSFETHNFSFSGVSEVYEMIMMDVSGASEIPVTKLFGRSPSGMNATGEGDMENYYDFITAQQDEYLKPIIDKLLPIMSMSVLGAIPDDLTYEFNPCREPSEDIRKKLARETTSTVIEVYNAGLISDKTALKELHSHRETTGMWNSVSDEDLKNADSSLSDIDNDKLLNLFNSLKDNTIDSIGKTNENE